MRLPTLAWLFVLAAGVRPAAAQPASKPDNRPPTPAWSFNATIIEACIRPTFWQCHFNT